MTPQFISIAPVLPSADIARDVAWYAEKAGFTSLFANDMYAVIYRENIYIHLQWHADTADDPLNGGSAVRIFVKNIEPLFNEFVQRGTVAPDKLRLQTAWYTNEFGFYDLNGNALFMVEDLPYPAET